MVLLSHLHEHFLVRLLQKRINEDSRTEAAYLPAFFAAPGASSLDINLSLHAFLFLPVVCMLLHSLHSHNGKIDFELGFLFLEFLNVDTRCS
jgi:hypothetical protein